GLVEFEKQYSKTPYVYGGTSITRGMDFSAFLRDVFKKMYGRELPTTARQQATQGVDVPINQLLMKEGDRLYFKYKNSYIDHTGIYVGNGYYIHCNSYKHGVSVDYLWDKRPYSKLVSVKRFQ
ncbi:MAG: C40 family peptidase, partial [Armatimonadetes bacterium]|nr:C40 family peptidase [Candidatus Hippobium faecium]